MASNHILHSYSIIPCFIFIEVRVSTRRLMYNQGGCSWLYFIVSWLSFTVS